MILIVILQCYSSVSLIILTSFCQVVYWSAVNLSNLQSGIWMHIFAQSTGRCYKTNGNLPGGISRMLCIYKIEVTASLVPGLCSLPWDYCPSFGLFKSLHCDLSSFEFGLFSAEYLVVMTSKHHICVIGKLAEKSLFHSWCGSLKCLHSLVHGLPFLVRVKYNDTYKTLKYSVINCSYYIIFSYIWLSLFSGSRPLTFT